MHDQVGVGQALVDGDEDVHLEDGAIGLLGELVGAVAGADGDGQRVNAGALGKLDCLVGIGDVLEAASRRRRGRLQRRPGRRFRLRP